MISCYVTGLQVFTLSGCMVTVFWVWFSSNSEWTVVRHLQHRVRVLYVPWRHSSLLLLWVCVWSVIQSTIKVRIKKSNYSAQNHEYLDTHYYWVTGPFLFDNHQGIKAGSQYTRKRVALWGVVARWTWQRCDHVTSTFACIVNPPLGM